MARDELDDRQLIALDLLMAGGTQQEAADAANVTRQTVNAWCTTDPLFISERQIRRMLRTARVDDRIHALVERSLDVTADKLDEGDLRAANLILRMVATGRFEAPEPEAPSSTSEKTGSAFLDFCEAMLEKYAPKAGQDHLEPEKLSIMENIFIGNSMAALEQIRELRVRAA